MANNTVELSIIAIDSASNIIENIGSKFGILGELGAAAMAAIAAAGVFAVKELGALSEEGARAGDVQAMFNSIISTSPLLDYKNQLLDLAAAYSKTTRFEDENIVSAETVLLRYQNLSQDVMPLAIKTTLNLATMMGTDATSAAQQLGKGLEDIAGGSLSLLARTRLLTAEQKDAAVAMAKAGDAAGAQAFVLDILDKKIGTLATDMGQTFAGKAKILQDAISNLREEMGIKLNDALMPLLDTFQAIFDKYAPMISTAFDTYVVPAVGRAVGIFNDFVLGLQSGVFYKFANDLKDLTRIDFGPLLQDIVAIFYGVQTGLATGNWDTLYGNIKNITGIDFKPFVDGVVANLKRISDWITNTGIPAFQNFVSTAKINMADFKVSSQVETSAIQAHWELMLKAISRAMNEVFGTDGINLVMDWKQIGITALQLLDVEIFGFTTFLNTAADGIVAVQTALYNLSQFASQFKLPSLPSTVTWNNPVNSGSGGGPNTASYLPHRASGGWASGLTQINEEGPEIVNLPNGSYVNNASASAKMMGGNFTFVYSPMFSMGNKQEAENVMAPIVANVVRRMQVDGRV